MKNPLESIRTHMLVVRTHDDEVQTEIVKLLIPQARP